MYKKRQRFYRDLTLNPDDELSELNEEDETEQKQNEEAINDTGSVGSSATHESIEAADEHNSVDASATTPTPTTVQKQEEPAYRPRSKSARMKSDKPVEIGYRSTVIDSRKHEKGIKKAKYDPGKLCIEKHTAKYLNGLLSRYAKAYTKRIRVAIDARPCSNANETSS